MLNWAEIIVIINILTGKYEVHILYKPMKYILSQNHTPMTMGRTQ